MHAKQHGAYFAALALTVTHFGAYLVAERFKRLEEGVIRSGAVVLANAAMACAVVICLRRIQQFIYFQF